MALAAGTRLGPYEIVAPLGAGGMGEVWRARDTKLGREVALKFLPPQFAEDTDRLARFEREAKTLAALNHPHIAHIHGLEESGDHRALVMELVEGQTLAERIARGAIPLDETLPLATQLAEALEYAHEHGVVHRDLKPANIKITPDGAVKVLDFGLAKALEGGPAGTDPANSPTITSPAMTRAGVILGTAAYMSPEQARGATVDKRADIWAFGVVLYEMLTGRRLFDGDTVSDTLANVLKAEPDWSALPPATPPLIRRLLARCLTKDARQRLHDIGDARLEIDEVAVRSAEGGMEGNKAGAGSGTDLWPRRRALAVAFAGLLAGTLAGAALTWLPSPVRPGAVVASTVKLEPGYWLEGGRIRRELERPTRTAMVISGDGRFLVYSAINGNAQGVAQPHLYLRRMEQLDARVVAGTEGGIGPFLSPDDRFVGFFADGKLRKVSVEGGLPVTLCDVVGSPFGATWTSDNRIVFSSAEGAGLSQIPAEGGRPESLTTPDRTREEYSHRLPHSLPGAKGILFTVVREYFDAQPRVAVLLPKTRQWRYLLDDAADARYVRTGHLVFLRRGTLMAVGFDLNRLEISGQPVPVVENVMQALYSVFTGNHTTAGQFSISDAGWLVYASGSLLPDAQNSLIWVDQQGNEEPAAPFKADFFSPRLSPDGVRIAYTNRGRDWRIWTYDLRRGIVGPLTSHPKAAYSSWTPDGTRVVFGWWKSGPYNLHWQPSDGSSPMERLTTSQYWQRPGPCSVNNVLAFLEDHPDTGSDLLLLDLSSRRSTPLVASGYNERSPEFSPDGRWIAYSSDKTGRDEVYVRALSETAEGHRISSEGGREPLWARDGTQVFYRWGGQVWVVGIRTDTGVSTSRPRLLFEKQGLAEAAVMRDWDLSLDGRRFLMVKREERKPDPATEMVAVQNWFEELKAKVPVK